MRHCTVCKNPLTEQNTVKYYSRKTKKAVIRTLCRECYTEQKRIANNRYVQPMTADLYEAMQDAPDRNNNQRFNQ